MKHCALIAEICFLLLSQTQGSALFYVQNNVSDGSDFFQHDSTMIHQVGSDNRSFFLLDGPDRVQSLKGAYPKK